MAVLKRLPWLTALVTTLDVASFAGFWVVNAARVRLSYSPQTSISQLARYVSWEHFLVAATWYLAIALAPLLVLQLVLWSKIRQATRGVRGLGWLMLACTLVGLVLMAMLGLAAAVSVGGGMVG